MNFFQRSGARYAVYMLLVRGSRVDKSGGATYLYLSFLTELAAFMFLYQLCMTGTDSFKACNINLEHYFTYSNARGLEVKKRLNVRISNEPYPGVGA